MATPCPASASASNVCGADGTGFADLDVNGHRETWPTRSKGFRRWLTRRFFEETDGAPNSEASLRTAIPVLMLWTAPLPKPPFHRHFLAVIQKSHSHSHGQEAHFNHWEAQHGSPPSEASGEYLDAGRFG
jgi:hypothetical protein